MISYHWWPFRDKHCQTGVPLHGYEVQSQRAVRTGNCGQQFDMRQLATVLKWHLSSDITVYILGHSQYGKSHTGALNRIHDFQYLVFQDLFWEMYRQAIDTVMVYVQKHLPMPTDDPERQSPVSKHCQPSSTGYRIILAKLSSWIRLPPWIFLPPQM